MGLNHSALGTITVILGAFSFAAGQAPLQVTCKSESVTVPRNVEGSVRVYAPVATASGGDGTYTFMHHLPLSIPLSGPPTRRLTSYFTVTDGQNQEATCLVRLAILEEGTCGTFLGDCEDPTPVRRSDDYICGGPCNASACCEEVCPNGDLECGEPHMQGLRGQRIDWSGVDGGWYCLIKDDNADLHVNVRLTAPLPDEYPNRQLITSLSILSEGRSLVIEVQNPYAIDTDGCAEGVSPCLANGGLRITVDGQEEPELLRFSRQVPVADGAFSMSATNLPVECRQFGGGKIWARMFQEMLDGRRQLAGGESLEDWILKYDHMAASDWCAKYIAENNLADLQSTHAVFKIETPTVTVRLNAGVNYQGDGDEDWDGRVLPDLEFWQMDLGMDGLEVENPALSGLLGETAHPVYDENGEKVMGGFEAFRGTVEDYRVTGALGTHFVLLSKGS